MDVDINISQMLKSICMCILNEYKHKLDTDNTNTNG